LIELLIVIGIIGVLAAVVLVSLSGARSSARDTKRVSDIRQIISALQLYYSDNGGYPLPATPTTTGPDASSGDPDWSTYLPSWPNAPATQDGSCTALENPYTYTQVASGADFTLSFCLGKAVSSITAGPHTATSAGF